MNWEFLSRNLGNRITPELVQGLANSINALLQDCWKEGFETATKAQMQAEGGLNLKVSETLTLDGYLFILGNYETKQQEVKPLMILHGQEMEQSRNPEAQVKISDEELIKKERAKRAHVFLIMFEERPVGYMAIETYLDRAMSVVVAQEMYFFIQKEHRKGWLAVKFIRWIEGILKQAGVYELRVGYRAVKDISILYKRLGYTRFASIDSKVL